MALVGTFQILPTDYDLCIKGLVFPPDTDINNPIYNLFNNLFNTFLDHALATSNIRHRVRYHRLEILYCGHDCELYVRLRFNGDREISDGNRDVVLHFCQALFAAETEAVALTISKYGILGFSSGQSSFGETWNSVAVKYAVLRYETRLDITRKECEQAKSKQSKWQICWNVVRTVIKSAIDYHFRSDPSSLGSDTEIINQFISRLNLDGDSVADHDAVSSVDKILRHIQQSLQEMPEAINTQAKQEIERELRAALKKFFAGSASIVQDINRLLGPNHGTVSLSDQFQASLALRQLFTDCIKVLLVSGVLSELYAQDCIQDTVFASVTSASAIVAVTKAWNVIGPQSLLTYIAGFVFGIDAADATTSAGTSVQATTTALRGGLFGFQQGRRAVTGARRIPQRLQQTEALQTVSKCALRLAKRLSQAQIVLTCIITTNGKVEFVGNPGSAWEAHLRAQFENEIYQEIDGPDSVEKELRRCAIDLGDFDRTLRLDVSKTNLKGFE